MAIKLSSKDFGTNLTKAEIDDLNHRIAIGMAEVAAGNTLDGPQALDLAIQKLESRHGLA